MKVSSVFSVLAVVATAHARSRCTKCKPDLCMNTVIIDDCAEYLSIPKNAPTGIDNGGSATIFQAEQETAAPVIRRGGASGIPDYASVCSDVKHYSSACRCLGYKPTKSTATGFATTTGTLASSSIATATDNTDHHTTTTATATSNGSSGATSVGTSTTGSTSATTTSSVSSAQSTTGTSTATTSSTSTSVTGTASSSSSTTDTSRTTTSSSTSTPATETTGTSSFSSTTDTSRNTTSSSTTITSTSSSSSTTSTNASTTASSSVTGASTTETGSSSTTSSSTTSTVASSTAPGPPCQTLTQTMYLYGGDQGYVESFVIPPGSHIGKIPTMTTQTNNRASFYLREDCSLDYTGNPNPEIPYSIFADGGPYPEIASYLIGQILGLNKVLCKPNASAVLECTINGVVANFYVCGKNLALLRVGSEASFSCASGAKPITMTGVPV